MLDGSGVVRTTAPTRWSYVGVGVVMRARHVAIDAIEERDKAGFLLKTGRLLIIGFVLTGLAGHAVAASACVSIFACENQNRPLVRPVADAGSPKNAAAARVEELYNGLPAGTDAENNEGYNAAQNAEQQLKLDFLGSFQSPQKNAANQTAWDEEEAQLISDSLKYGGDRTLDAAAMYWGETNLNLPVLSPQELLAQAKTMQVADQPGEREFAEYMANYLASRFDSFNRLASSYHSATDDIEGRNVPLDLADLQAELRIDEVDRTMGKSRP